MPVKDNEAQVNQRRDQSHSKKNPFVLTVKQRNYERNEAEHDVNLMYSLSRTGLIDKRFNREIL